MTRERCRCGAFAHGAKPCAKPGPQPRPILDRIWEKVDQRGPDECWPWTAYQHEKGYPRISVEGKMVTVGRIFCEMFYGPLQPGQVARHSCDWPPCCNPAHISPGTPAQNSGDMVVRGRSKTGERHWNARLTAEDVAAIRASTASSTVIAPRYGVTARYIRKVRSGTRWR